MSSGGEGFDSEEYVRVRKEEGSFGPLAPTREMPVLLEEDAQKLEESSQQISSEPIRPGRIISIGSRIILLEKLGSGGMAQVWKALHRTGIDKYVALKIPNYGKISSNSLSVEGNHASQLNHRSIAELRAYLPKAIKVDGQERDVIVMEYVNGKTAGEILRTHGRVPVGTIESSQSLPGLDIPEAFIAFWSWLATEAFHYAHNLEIISPEDGEVERGIYHSDINPNNLMITYEGELKIVDWGISATSQQIRKRSEGRESEIRGTLDFMAPEILARGDIDESIDIFGLGATMFNLASGERPVLRNFDTRGLSNSDICNELLRRYEGEAPKLVDIMGDNIDPDFSDIVAKAMAFDKRDRYSTAREMNGDLTNFLYNPPDHRKDDANPGPTRRSGELYLSLVDKRVRGESVDRETLQTAKRMMPFLCKGEKFNLKLRKRPYKNKGE